MKILRPSLLEEIQKAEILFTEANRELVSSGSGIDGLNLGYNTDAPAEEVDENFDRLLNELYWNSMEIAVAKQVHGDHIETVEVPGVVPDTDGLVTKKAGLAIGIRVADCAAVLAVDPVNKVAGAFHAGWKGAALEIVKKGIGQMTELGADPNQILAWVSPCISLKNFEVGEEVASQFPDRFVDRTSYKKPHVDLPSFIHNQLLESGVKDSSIEISRECTMENRQFYSYRREGRKAGRMIGLVRLV